MAYFFSKPAPPRVEDHPSNRTSNEGSRSGSPKPSSEKESTSLEASRDTAAGRDTDKEAANNGNANDHANDWPDAVQDSYKEAVPRRDEGQETSNPEEPNDSGASSADPKEIDETEYPSGWRLFLITVALCLCVFCVALVRSLLATQPIQLLTR